MSCSSFPRFWLPPRKLSVVLFSRLSSSWLSCDGRERADQDHFLLQSSWDESSARSIAFGKKPNTGSTKKLALRRKRQQPAWWIRSHRLSPMDYFSQAERAAIQLAGVHQSVWWKSLCVCLCCNDWNKCALNLFKTITQKNVLVFASWS